MATEIRIVHVSDIHLREGGRDLHQLLPGVSPAPPTIADSLFDCVGGLIQGADGSTVGVLSGDLSLLGADNDIVYAKARWDASVPATQGTYVLGNHDFWDDSIARTVLLAPWTHKRIKRAYWPDPPTFHLDCGALRVHFYLLDTTPSAIRRVPRNLVARGDYPAGDIKRVSGLIADHRAEDQAAGISSLSIAVMHHPIHKIRRSALFRAWLSANGIGLVLAGHTHKGCVLPRGDKEVICPSSTISKPPAFMLHEIEYNGGSSAAVRTVTSEWSDGIFQPTEPTHGFTVYIP